MKRYLIQAEAAEVYNCKRQTIAVAMRPGKALHPAIHRIDGKKYIDMCHPDARSYRVSHQIGKLPKPDPEEHVPDRTSAPTHLPEQIRECWQWTLERIIRERGTEAQFEKLLAAADKIESIHSKRLAADKSTGELISRDMVHKHVTGLIERVFQQLLEVMPVRLSYQVHGLCETGESIEAIQEAIRTAVGLELKGIKQGTNRAIKKC